MFAKLLAELKRIAILLQSKKLVDKDYKPDEGGDDSKVNDFIIFPSILDTRILKFNYSDLIKLQTVEYKTYTVGELLTDEFINFVNANKEEFLNYKIDNVYGSYFTNKIDDNKYEISNINSTMTKFEIWHERESDENKLSMKLILPGNYSGSHIFLELNIDYETDFVELTKDLILNPTN